MSFVELALQGEQLCKAGQLSDAISVFKTALRKDTSDPEIKTAVYSQIGNAYFYLKDYIAAKEFHEKELELALVMTNKKCCANAFGNLGNTLRALSLFTEAVDKCQSQLTIWRELGSRTGEARALYNLGNIFHAKAKQSDDAGRDIALNKAIEYYDNYLAIVKAINDQVLMGRAYGNLGNAHYRLGAFETAIDCHMERLKIAEAHQDVAAQRRAYTNLGNANVFLGNFQDSVRYYVKVRRIAVLMDDECIEAQAVYSLGATYALMNNHTDAISYYKEHLKFARKLNDLVGEGRAYWALGNAYKQLGNKDLAAQYTRLHLEIRYDSSRMTHH
jgi:G-protein signaling modulator 2